jgi:hypothetical protein
MEMCGLIQARNLPKASAFCVKAFFNFSVVIDLYEIRRHSFLRRWAWLSA